MTKAELVHHYCPRGSAVTILESRDSELLVSGMAGTGKSRACLEKMLLVALRYPGMRGVIVRKTQVSLGNTALKTWREHVATEFLENGTVSFYGGSAAESPQYRFSNGSSIMIVGMDKASRIMSAEYDLAFCQEATELTLTDWEFIITRLRNGRVPYQQLIADCNPDTPTHWLKKRCESGATRLVYSRHEDNPLLFDLLPDGGHQLTEFGRNYLERLDALTGVRHQRLRLGLWVAAEGLVYEEFDPSIHILDPFEIPLEWPRFWSVDFGFTNPTVIQCWAEDPDGRLYLYRELYRTRRTVDQHARDLLAIVAPKGKWREPRPYAVICDHDAENRARLEAELDIGTTAADKNVKDGIETVQRRLRPAGDDRPRIFLLSGAVVEQDQALIDASLPTSTLEEMPGYAWLPPVAGRPAKEEPRKENDHGCDAMRYLVMFREGLTSPRLRFLS